MATQRYGNTNKTEGSADTIYIVTVNMELSLYGDRESHTSVTVNPLELKLRHPWRGRQ